MTFPPLNEVEQRIIDNARKSPLAWTVQTEQDQRNLLEFVREVAVCAVVDSDYRRALLEVK